MLIIFGLLCSANRLNKMEVFSQDALVQELLGLSGSIDAETISNRIKRNNLGTNSILIDIIGKLSNKIHSKISNTNDILDLDSTVRTVYGHQEGSCKGFNSHKRGAKSYHPLLGFLQSTKECLCSWFRSGDAYTSNNCVAFLEQTFRHISSGIRELLVRADSGFFDGKILTSIESRANTDYIIKVKMKGLRELLSNQNWVKVAGNKDYEETEFEYKASSWEKSRKMVAIRKVRKVVHVGVLFPIVEYDYSCFVTNKELSGMEIYQIYKQRGECENYIEATKNQLFAGCVMTKGFDANETFWLLSILAYNISVWMRKLTDHKSWQEEPATFRTWFIQVAGKVVRSGRQVFLKMYSAYYYKQRWKNIENNIINLEFT